jgi:chromosome segregation ATPase
VTDTDEQLADRRARWELAERVAELEAEVAERAHREDQRERELDALRHELELRLAHDAAREERIAAVHSQLQITRGELEWLHGHAMQMQGRFDRALIDLIAERDDARRQVVALQVELRSVEAELRSVEAELGSVQDRLRATEAGLPYRIARLAADVTHGRRPDDQP